MQGNPKKQPAFPAKMPTPSLNKSVFTGKKNDIHSDSADLPEQIVRENRASVEISIRMLDHASWLIQKRRS